MLDIFKQTDEHAIFYVMVVRPNDRITEGSFLKIKFQNFTASNVNISWMVIKFWIKWEHFMVESWLTGATFTNRD